VTAVDGETSHPPHSGILCKHSCQRSVADHACKVRSGPYPCPSDRLIIDISDEPRRYVGMGDLVPQRVAVVGSGSGGADSQIGERGRADTNTTQIFTTATEHRDEVAPTIRGSRGVPELTWSDSRDRACVADSRSPYDAVTTPNGAVSSAPLTVPLTGIAGRPDVGSGPGSRKAAMSDVETRRRLTRPAGDTFKPECWSRGMGTTRSPDPSSGTVSVRYGACKRLQAGEGLEWSSGRPPGPGPPVATAG